MKSRGKYDQEPKDVNSCKILNTGVNISRPVFEYTETFTLDNLVKKPAIITLLKPVN